MRYCLFCGASLVGSKKSFEHVFPKWLVQEADLAKRTMAVWNGTDTKQIGMGKIGCKVCDRCNNDRSTLESNAKAAYGLVVNGDDINQDSAESLLDWFDKVRVGFWLWYINVNKTFSYIDPKFHINSRIGTKDRLLLINRYKPDKKLKGMAIWGVGPHFGTLPSVLGLLINNIAFVSVSYEFIMLRHWRNLVINRSLDDSDNDGYDPVFSSTPGRRMNTLGWSYGIGQVILPDSLVDLDIDRVGISKWNAKYDKTQVNLLNKDLSIRSGDLGSVPEFSVNASSNSVLMDINTAIAQRFIFEEAFYTDLSGINDPKIRHNVIENARYSIRIIESYEKVLKGHYLRLTNIKI